MTVKENLIVALVCMGLAIFENHKYYEVMNSSWQLVIIQLFLTGVMGWNFGAALAKYVKNRKR
jgi:putative effector of murein hydrolase